MSDAIRAAFGSLIKAVSAEALSAEESGDEAEFTRVMEFRSSLAKLRDNFFAGAGAKAPRKPRGPRKATDAAPAADAPASAEAAPAVEAPAAPAEAPTPAAPGVRRRAA